MKGEFQIEIISPLHIGSGEILGPFDLYVQPAFNPSRDRDNLKCATIIDHQKLFDHPSIEAHSLTEGFSKERHIYNIIGDKVKEVGKYELEKSFTRRELEELAKEGSRTVFSDIVGWTRKGEMKGVHENIKTINKQPYIPGSSIKGSIRSAILSQKLRENKTLRNQVWNEVKNELVSLKDQLRKDWNDRNGLLKKKERRIGEIIEKKVFGSDPKTDLFKALQITDTQPISIQRMKIFEIVTENIDPQGSLKPESYSNFIEGITPQTSTQCQFYIDDFLLDSSNKRLFDGQAEGERLFDLVDICKANSHKLIKEEIEFYKNHDFNPGIRFYEKELSSINESEHQFLIPLGWGTGQNLKSIIDLLDKEKIRYLFSFKDRKETRLGKIVCKKHPRWEVGPDRFTPLFYFCKKCKDEGSDGKLNQDDVKFLPYSKTRRFIFENGEPKYPLGWIKVKVVR